MQTETPAPGRGGIKFHPVPTQRASEAIYDQIKALIVSGELRPGDRLPSERSLMDTLQRSRPTIREALRMLEHAGLIKTVAGSNGAVVCSPGTEEVEESLTLMLRASRVTVAELAEYRLANDTAVVRWAAERRTEADLASLGEILDAAEALLPAREYERFIRHDADFHESLARAGKNTVAALLSRILSSLTEPKVADRLIRQNEAENADMCRRILSMHREILSTVKDGNADAAERAMAHHIHVFGADLAE